VSSLDNAANPEKMIFVWLHNFLQKNFPSGRKYEFFHFILGQKWKKMEILQTCFVINNITSYLHVIL
jgi:hypothetical protein